MDGIPQVGILANKPPENLLEKYGFYQAQLAPSMWNHKTHPMQVMLVVYDLRIQYKKDVEYLVNYLKNHYEYISKDWEGRLLSGVTLKHKYYDKTLNLSMHVYIKIPALL